MYAISKARPGSRPRRDPGKISAGTGIPVPARFHLPGPGSLPGFHENFTNFSGNCLTFVMKLLQISHTILTNFWQIYSNLSSGAGISTLYHWKKLSKWNSSANHRLILQALHHRMIPRYHYHYHYHLKAHYHHNYFQCYQFHTGIN